MRERIQRRDRSTPELNITAFMNLMVVLVPFLLITAVFSRITILQLNLPEGSNNAIKNLKKEMHLEVIIRKDYLDVGTREAGRIQCVKSTNNTYDYKKLSALVAQIKLRIPDKKDISLLAEPGTPYDILVQVMDKVRSTKQTRGTEVVDAELFPNVSIGDAPPLNEAQKKAGCI